MIFTIIGFFIFMAILTRIIIWILVKTDELFGKTMIKREDGTWAERTRRHELTGEVCWCGRKHRRLSLYDLGEPKK